MPTEDFRNSKRFVTWSELQEEYAKRDALKKDRRDKLIKYIAGMASAIILGLVLYFI